MNNNNNTFKDNSMTPNAKYNTISTSTIVTTVGSKDGNEDGDEAVSSLNVEIAFVKGQVQEPEYRDKWFAVLFLIHLGTMVVVASLYANGTLATEMVNFGNRRSLVQRVLNDPATTIEDAIFPFFILFFMTLLLPPILSILSLKLMVNHGAKLIQYSLYFAIGFQVLLAILLLLYSGPAHSILPAFFACILLCYMKAVWHRIPYAAANLKAAVTCVQGNAGITFMAMSTIPLKIIWLCVWAYTVTCVVHSPWMKLQESEVELTDDFNGVPNTHESETFSTQGSLAIAALTLSLHWTFQVITNVVQTTVAGTVGTWWFVPQEANGCCSRGLTDSLGRSLTFSFGSICLGSLLVAIIEVIQSMLRGSARSRRSGLLRCIAQCLLVWIDRIAQYFNKWAFVYVGLYGYSYVQAGKNVITLFTHRGWTAIISDRLIVRMLFMVVFCIGLVNALLTTLFTSGSVSGDMTFSALVFLISFFTGIAVSASILHVLVNAVDSIIVLYAEAPADFKDNYPELAAELETTWSQAWPDLFTPSAPPVAVGHPVV